MAAADNNDDNKYYSHANCSTQETTPARVADESPYLLFYEREDLSYDKVIPDFSDRNAIVLAEEEDDVDAEVKKICTIQ